MTDAFVHAIVEPAAVTDDIHSVSGVIETGTNVAFEP